MDWNFMDQLRRVDLGGGGTAHYVYGPSGQRLRKVIERNGNLNYARSTADGEGQLPVGKDLGIETYPTWIAKDGTRKSGTLSLTDLSTFTGCKLAKDGQ